MMSILVAVDGNDGFLQRMAGPEEGFQARLARLDDSLRCAGQSEAVAVAVYDNSEGGRRDVNGTPIWMPSSAGAPQI